MAISPDEATRPPGPINRTSSTSSTRTISSTKVCMEQEAGWQRMGSGIDLEALAADATRSRRPRTRQVNVRLTELGYDALCQAAQSYGLRPTTLARLLVHRGALAVFEARENGGDPGR
jgi:hypothetical protein